MAQQCIKARVYGRVQGVGFRYSTQAQAQQLGLTGYARNLDDGIVEVLACGDNAQLEQLLAWLKAGGPRSARRSRADRTASASGDAAAFHHRLSG